MAKLIQVTPKELKFPFVEVGGQSSSLDLEIVQLSVDELSQIDIASPAGTKIKNSNDSTYVQNIDNFIIHKPFLDDVYYLDTDGSLTTSAAPTGIRVAYHEYDVTLQGQTIDGGVSVSDKVYLDGTVWKKADPSTSNPVYLGGNIITLPGYLLLSFSKSRFTVRYEYDAVGSVEDTDPPDFIFTYDAVGSVEDV